MTVCRSVVFRVDAFEMVGELLRVDGHFARTGTQRYRDGMGGETVEYRSPDQVFDDASLASWRGVPVTVRHPQGVGGTVTSSNWSTLAGKGVVVGHMGDDIARSDDGIHAKASLWISDASAQRQVQSKELIELSGGYTANLNKSPGTSPDGERYDAKQENIRGNHVALLGPGEARGGPTVRVLDAEGHEIFYDDGQRRPKERLMKLTIHADGYPHEVEAADDRLKVALKKDADAAEAAHKAEVDALKAELADAKETAAAEKKRADKAEGEKDAAVEALKTHPAVIKADEDAQAKLLADAAKVAGCDVTGDSPEAIRRAALAAKGIDVKDKSNEYVEARFDALAEDAPKQGSAADNMRTELRDPVEAVKLDADKEKLTRL